MENISDLFGSMVFNDKVMREKLPKDIYHSLMKTVREGKPLKLNVANAVASAMKDWAMSKGATHFTHWFQPMTGVTAEKHDSFLSPDGPASILVEFSGKELVKGEPDASSFPSGGLRATFEARGYTAWDPTSYAFVKDNTLYIPTAFCSYSGEALDKKTPLLRSMEALEKQSLRVLKLFGNEQVKRVHTTVGPEQEYFLIDKSVYLKRPDLINCGRTLFGAKPPKGQEMDDHYFGSIKDRVKSFMKELDEELWKLGVFAKTKHNESAPAQHEFAPVFSSANIATDHNQLTMELMKSVANKHGMACLLHEKPFSGINGSGKHNNWAISTDTSINLFEPGDTPRDNTQFLLFLMAVIKAVDEFQDLLRVTVSSAGNDHRLGSHEAPPAIVSIFLGNELTEIMESIENNTLYANKEIATMEAGVIVLPHFPKDTTDRNRTSPFAFTGNKFEFRMLGSSFSIAGPNFVLNTIVANSLSEFANKLENAENFGEELHSLIIDTYKKHKRIIFNGNNYSAEWIEEANRRGLLNLKTTPDALPYFIKEKNIKLFEKFGVLTRAEILSRYEILSENYCKTIVMESLTMTELVRKEVIPGVLNYENKLAKTLNTKKQLNLGLNLLLEESLLTKLSTLGGELLIRLENLVAATNGLTEVVGIKERALYVRKNIYVGMVSLREIVDELESLVAAGCWNLPTYSEILTSVN